MFTDNNQEQTYFIYFNKHMFHNSFVSKSNIKRDSNRFFNTSGMVLGHFYCSKNITVMTSWTLGIQLLLVVRNSDVPGMQCFCSVAFFPMVILRNHFRNNTAKTLDLETCELPPYLVTDHKYEQIQMSGESNYPFPKIPIPSLSSKYKVHFIKIKGNNYFSQIICIV